MYQINILNEKIWKWEQLTFNGKPMLFSSKSTLYKALKDNLGVKVQILYNDWYLISLDGTYFQLDLFKKEHDHLLDKTIQCIETQKRYDEMNPKVKSKVKKIERRTANETK